MPSPEPLIFIDANVYLSFYEAKRDHLFKLLRSLTEAAPRIFVTEQIVHEVRRNQVKVFLEQAQQLMEKVPTSIELPAFHASPGSAEQKSFAKKLKQVKAPLNDLIADYKKLCESMAQEIRESSDPVSKRFDTIFLAAKPATEAQMARARLRKERGNPPGKRADPLGDQISWEQLLDAAMDGQSIWVISRDGDYWDRSFGSVHLKAMLYQELKNKVKGGEVHCFAELATGFGHFSKQAAQLISLPNEQDLRAIVAEEAEAVEEQSTIVVPRIATGVGWAGPGIVTTRAGPPCPRCHSHRTMVVTLPGGPLMRYPPIVCQACGEEWADGRS